MTLHKHVAQDNLFTSPYMQDTALLRRVPRLIDTPLTSEPFTEPVTPIYSHLIINKKITAAIASGLQGCVGHAATMPRECHFNSILMNDVLNIKATSPSTTRCGMTMGLYVTAHTVEKPIQWALTPHVGDFFSAGIASGCHELVEAAAARLLLLSQCGPPVHKCGLGLGFSIGGGMLSEWGLLYGQELGNTPLERIQNGVLFCGLGDMLSTPLRVGQRARILNTSYKDLFTRLTPQLTARLMTQRGLIGGLRGGAATIALESFKHYFGLEHFLHP